MSVYCQQHVDGEQPDEAYIITQHPTLSTDRELLLRKAAGATDKGWDVEWLGPTEFVARKVRWSPDVMCERHFWIEP